MGRYGAITTGKRKTPQNSIALLNTNKKKRRRTKKAIKTIQLLKQLQ